jgi:hypothetical protein
MWVYGHQWHVAIPGHLQWALALSTASAQDLERAQHLHAADQQRASLRLAAAEEALGIERQLNQHLKQQLRASEERTRSVIETEGRARHAEVATLQQMYGHAAQVLGSGWGGGGGHRSSTPSYA